MDIKKYISILKTPVIFSFIMFVICGLAYPLLMTGASQAIFPWRANGSIIYEGGNAVGSAIVGQEFSDARFMKLRPSAVNYNTYTEAEKASGDYTGMATGSQNLAPSNPKLAERINADIKKFLETNPSIKIGSIPAELLTASGSGLDPHISPESAAVQIPALAKAIGISEKMLSDIVKKHTSGKLMGVFGEDTVNVLALNLEIAKLTGIIK